MSKGNGRPSIYSPEIAEEVCDRLADGESLRHICQDNHLPDASTVHRWVLEDREGFYKQYTRARESQALRWAEEILEIADNQSQDWRVDEKGNLIAKKEHVARSRLRVDTRKWLLSKVLPKIYGDKLTLGGDRENPLRLDVAKWSDEELVQRARQITNRLAAVKGNGSDG